MDNSDYTRNRQNEHLGVNKIGKYIRKSPLHQPNLANPDRQPAQPQVYNINKNDFRDVVQRLTGSPARHSQEPLDPPKPSSSRLQSIRPPSLAPLNVNRPQMPTYNQPRAMVPRSNQYGQPASQPPPMSANAMESPISAYMRYLQHSIIDSKQGYPHPQAHPQYTQHQPSPGLLPSPRMNGRPPIPSPRTNGFPPMSPFVLPSPSGYLNLLSPLSPNPLLSPGYQHPPPLTPSFSFSPMAQSGILGPGPQPLPSPGMGFPFSPGFFQMLSPRWRN